jgi:hypothetical protein
MATSFTGSISDTQMLAAVTAYLTANPPTTKAPTQAQVNVAVAAYLKANPVVTPPVTGVLVPYPPAGKTYPTGADWEKTPIRTTPLFEDFTGPAGSPPPALFPADTQWQGGTQEYRKSHCFLDGNSNLVIRCDKLNLANDSDPNPATAKWVSGHIQCKNQWAMGYGKLEVRAKLPATGPGLVPAIWTLGVPMPTAMEFDIVETLTSAPTVVEAHYVPHVDDGAGGSKLLDGGATKTTIADTSKDFHTYWWERIPGRVRMGVDSITTLEVTPATAKNAPWEQFEYPQYLILNVATNQWGGDPTAATQFPADMLIDWVRYTPLTA